MKVVVAQTPKEKNAAFDIRKSVFIEEQHVPINIERDGADEHAIHFIGYENHHPVAASRLRFEKTYGKLERICVLQEHRGKSYGIILIKEMEKTIVENNFSQARLNAQAHAQTFYESLGYHVISEPFLDAGILHVTMVKQL